MYVAILIPGILRSFKNVLYPFLNQLPENYHIFISCPRQETADRFYNESIDITTIINNDRFVHIQVDDTLPQIDSSFSTRERNTIIQWWRLNTLFQSIDSMKYKKIIRLRPDIQIDISVQEFLNIIETCDGHDTLYIPHGYDIFDSRVLESETQHPNCINDQFAIGSYDIMKIYVNAYISIRTDQPLISEKILYNYLQNLNVHIERVDLPYHLVLSKVEIISICGDSGAGKTELSKALQIIFPFDQQVILETDRYHKWERGSPKWQETTHLDPNANNLEKMSEDIYKLRIGETVYNVDYDHNTGKFTSLQQIESKPFILLCGLHTLYKKQLRQVCDIKFYVDTDTFLKVFWKVRRDMVKRGYTYDQVLTRIQQRQLHYEQYILPQRDLADIILHYYSPDIAEMPTENTIRGLQDPRLMLNILISATNTDLINKLRALPVNILTQQPDKGGFVVFSCGQNISNLNHYTTYPAKLDDSYVGICQLIAVYALFK